MDIGAIKARIAELEQRKAERNALRGYRDLAYLDYMTKGDRSGFDRIDADEVAYRNMIAQQKFQEQQNALNRENALNLAYVSRANAIEDKKDEMIRLRGKALSGLQYAEQSLKYAMDKGDANAINAAERDVQLAKEDLAYYNSKLGYKEPTKEVSSEPEPSLEGQETPVNLSVDIERYKALKKGKKAELDSILKEIKDNPNFNQSPELQREYQRISKIKSEEQLESEKAARRAKWEEGKKLSGYELREWADVPENKNLLKEFGPIGRYKG